MQAYMLFCAANTTEKPASSLGYSNSHLRALSVGTQIADRRKEYAIPDNAIDPCISIGRVAINLGTVSYPDWRICSLPIKTHGATLYVDKEKFETLQLHKLEEKLIEKKRVDEYIKRINLL